MKRLLGVVATLLVASVLLTACGGGAPAGVAGEPGAADAGAAACGADQYCVGFVTDTGGILSHPAIIAREYGIPAVVATGNGTTLIRDGQQVEVDGDAGVVRIC